MLRLELQLMRWIDMHILVHHLWQFRIVQSALYVLVEVLWILTVLLLVLPILVVI